MGFLGAFMDGRVKRDGGSGMKKRGNGVWHRATGGNRTRVATRRTTAMWLAHEWVEPVSSSITQTALCSVASWRRCCSRAISGSVPSPTWSSKSLTPLRYDHPHPLQPFGFFSPRITNLSPCPDVINGTELCDEPHPPEEGSETPRCFMQSPALPVSGVALRCVVRLKND